MNLDTLRSVPIFRTLDDAATFEIWKLLSFRELEAGVSIFHAGDPGDAMFLIESGSVRISVKDADGQDAVLVDLGKGEFFGEMAVLDNQSRSADATVIHRAKLAVLAREDLLSLVRKRPDIALGMLTAMTQRLRHTTDLVRHRVSRNANEEDAANLTMADRAADLIAEFGGSWKFIAASITFTLLWIAFNSWFLWHPFDKYPYTFLNLVLGVVAGLQAPIIMMSQNRQGQKDRLRADLDYRVNLKNEVLLSEVLRRLNALEPSKDSRHYDDLKLEDEI
jgi:uncharacterized membrane protein